MKHTTMPSAFLKSFFLFSWNLLRNCYEHFVISWANIQPSATFELWVRFRYIQMESWGDLFFGVRTKFTSEIDKIVGNCGHWVTPITKILWFLTIIYLITMWIQWIFITMVSVSAVQPSINLEWLHGSTWVFSSFSYNFMHNFSFLKICRLLFLK